MESGKKQKKNLVTFPTIKEKDETMFVMEKYERNISRS